MWSGRCFGPEVAGRYVADWREARVVRRRNATAPLTVEALYSVVTDALEALLLAVAGPEAPLAV